MHRFANPKRFSDLSARLRSPLTVLCLLLVPVMLVWSLVIAPADYQQGEAYRIIYVHVPAAWMAMFTYASIVVSSIVALIWRHPLAEVAGRAAAPVGAVFTAIALFTGSVWGQPMWGTWWVWDARLTSVLILFFLYLGYIALHDAFDDPARGGRAAAILAIVGAVNLPVIKFSVDWWNTLHQPSTILRFDGPAIDPSMLWPLLGMIVVFKLYLILVMLWRIELHLNKRRIANLQLSASAEA